MLFLNLNFKKHKNGSRCKLYSILTLGKLKNNFLQSNFMLFGNFKNSQVTVLLSLPDFHATVTYCSDYFLVKKQGFFLSVLRLGSVIEETT